MTETLQEAASQQLLQRPHLAPLISRIRGEWDPHYTTKIKRVWCGPGWDDILVRLDQDLVKLDPTYEVLQVKEKFGSLRYYTNHKCGETCNQIPCPFLERIKEAEEEAQKQCRHCGAQEPCQTHVREI